MNGTELNCMRCICFLNPSQREELENEVRSQEKLAVLQVEFADMKGQMRSKLPINLTNKSMCKKNTVKINAYMANLLRETELIIWDEAPMNYQRCYETLDRTLRDLLNAPGSLFREKSVMLGGDFMQTPLTNLSEDRKKDIETFSSWLLEVGDGKIGMLDESDTHDSSWIKIPDRHCILDDNGVLSELINFIYDQEMLQRPSDNQAYVSSDGANLYGNDGG
ncbi:DNA helicase [Tanacetum coccineum]